MKSSYGNQYMLQVLLGYVHAKKEGVGAVKRQ